MKVAFHTLGCKVNQYETEKLRENFAQRGYGISGDGETADVFVINTCTVTGLSDRKSRQHIRRMRKLNPEGIIAVVGCYAEVSPEEVAGIEGVDLVLGTRDKMCLPEKVEEILTGRGISIPSPEAEDGQDGHGAAFSPTRTRAFLKVQDGCDRFCAYCIIPYARGKIQSRLPGEVREEAQYLLNNGIKEIVLTGINTALYGSEEEFGTKNELSGVEVIVEELSSLPGEFRLRLSSLEPTVVDAQYVERLFAYDKLCRHIHLSMQSGSDRILRQMNRRYTALEYRQIIDKILDFDPLYGVSTDIIVGFPGEKDEDFEESVKLLQEVDFCKVHVFKYSRRKGTAAAGMEEQIPETLKNMRSEKLLAEADVSARRFFEKNIGCEAQVLIEESTENDAWLTGYTGNYIKVYIENTAADKQKARINCMAKVRLRGIYLDGMRGEMLPEEEETWKN